MKFIFFLFFSFWSVTLYVVYRFIECQVLLALETPGSKQTQTLHYGNIWKWCKPGGHLWICSHCKKEYKSSHSQVKAHLCFISYKGIKFCPSKPRVPREPQSKTLLANSIALKYIEERKQIDETIGNAVVHPLESSKSKKGLSKEVLQNGF